MWAAMRRRIGVCGTFRIPASTATGSRAGACAIAVDAATFGAAASTSSTVIRPPSPLPVIWSAPRPRSANKRRTAGLNEPPIREQYIVEYYSR